MPRPGAVDPVASRFGSALIIRDGTEEDKPDDGGGGLLGSPVSPLRLRDNPSSSSSSSGSAHCLPQPPARSEETSPTAAADGGRGSKPTLRRSGSGQLVFSARAASGGECSSASSPLTNVLPAGNICPSGKITCMVPRTGGTRSDVLGSGTGNYGHGSIMRRGRAGGDAETVSRGDPSAKRAEVRADPQEVTRAGNEQYKRGSYGEALRLYDKAVAMCPGNAACRSNRAAALAGLGRLGEAVRECQEALRLDPSSYRAHHRLATLYLRLGQMKDAKQHIFLTGNQPDSIELQKLQRLERHLGKSGEARKIGDWKSALSEAEAAIAAGADSSPTIMAAKAEALLRLHRFDEADSVSACSLKSEKSPSNAKFFGLHPDSYMYIVRAQVDMSLGRFENAVELAEKGRRIDPRNMELTLMVNNVKSVARARSHGNELFKSGNFAEAGIAYGQGLKLDPSNPVLLCNRAACWSKLEQWEKSIDDCNQALKIQPNYIKIKVLLRRADSNAKLERWAESVRDYKVLSEEIPGDAEVTEALFNAEVALKISRGEGVSNSKFGGEVEDVTSLKQFQAAICLPATSVIYFMATSNLQCSHISPLVDSLCTRYPTANFLKVDIDKSHAVAKSESVRVVPTVKIYRNGIRIKEMICPSQRVLEYSVGHYSQGGSS